MSTRKARGIPGDKSICLPIGDDIDYATLVEDRERYQTYLDKQIAQHPELFPADISGGYRFHGFVNSVRQGIKTRRIRLTSTQDAYQIRPDLVTPYMKHQSKRVKRCTCVSMASRLKGLPMC